MQSTRLSEKTWKVSGIDEDRKRRLLTWEFPNIVQEICRTAIPKTAPDSNGIDSVLELHVDPILVDLFHNGSGGYRAQFYEGVTKGRAANTFALLKLLPIVRRIDREFKFTSRTTIWICEQGDWFNEEPQRLQNLDVARWRDAEERGATRCGKLWRLMPYTEHRLVIRNRKKSSGLRGDQIHLWGYSQ
ncbi:MAG: hypothetical protein U1E46_18570 [Hyphomicrobiales bacterium]